MARLVEDTLLGLLSNKCRSLEYSTLQLVASCNLFGVHYFTIRVDVHTLRVHDTQSTPAPALSKKPSYLRRKRCRCPRQTAWAWTNILGSRLGGLAA
ncbi:hypothetical protein HBH74_205540 [Parastagonospora nodorum]|nr:hypothetical protein HBI05_225100 [Parastagonospora nodorum]KAH4892707.1 hypothetical protein HBH74_205540 [Parastagonospora nodorum]KAH5008439.1 hypothetical protein HBI75_214180 [Parastagonospora nodorum]KAH6195219.1 hypothetical protein HBI15_222440 [Parastagonospora nodorum]